MAQQPHLAVNGPKSGARAVVLLLHGGPEVSTDADRPGLAYARMVPFAAGIAHAARGKDVAVWSMRYRVRGWNAPAEDPVRDGRPVTASVLIAHGDHDRTTDPAGSAAYAARIGASFVPVPGESHALLRRPVFWQRLVTGFVRTVLGATSPAH
jgi:pimeloyl-ACP methyl ester carboxylesterase